MLTACVSSLSQARAEWAHRRLQNIAENPRSALVDLAKESPESSKSKAGTLSQSTSGAVVTSSETPALGNALEELAKATSTQILLLASPILFMSFFDFTS